MKLQRKNRKFETNFVAANFQNKDRLGKYNNGEKQLQKKAVNIIADSPP